MAEDDHPVLLRRNRDGLGRVACEDTRLAQAAWNAASQSAGCCSLRGGDVAGCAARPDATMAPVSTSRTWTLHAVVDESTPTTRGTSAPRAAVP